MKNKLDEIILQHCNTKINDYGTHFESINEKQCKEAMLEFTKHVLNEAAQEVETVLWQNNGDLEIVGNRAKYIIENIEIKNVITSTIDKNL